MEKAMAEEKTVGAGEARPGRIISAGCCPFCGYGENRVFLDYSPDGTKFFLRCTVCRACGPEAQTKLLAFPMWNMRNFPPPQCQPRREGANG